MFRTFRIMSVLLVTSLAVVGQQVDLKAIGTLSQQQLILVALALVLGFTNLLVEIFDHRRRKKDSIKRAKEFENRQEWDYDHSGHLIKYPLGADLTFYRKMSKGHSASPDLQLTYGALGGHLPKNPFPFEEHKGIKLTSLELHNGELYLDFITYDWAIQQNSNQLLSIFDLRGAKAKFILNITTRDDQDFVMPPSFTIIELKCGERPYNVIRLNSDIFGNPTINSKESWHFAGDNPDRPDSHLCIFYEFILPDADFEKYVQQFN